MLTIQIRAFQIGIFLFVKLFQRTRKLYAHGGTLILSGFSIVKKLALHSNGSGFTHYLTRDEDHLFMVLVKALPTGCIGIRLLDDHWDLYNVIRGVHRLHSRGCMGTALHHVIEFALQRKAIPVQLKVLAKNLRTTGIKITDFPLSKLRKTTLSCSIRLFHRHLQTS